MDGSEVADTVIQEIKQNGKFFSFFYKEIGAFLIVIFMGILFCGIQLCFVMKKYLKKRPSGNISIVSGKGIATGGHDSMRAAQIMARNGHGVHGNFERSLPMKLPSFRSVLR
ncbi:MAG: hypothetical protein ACI4SG_03075 [Oligosphaeraceae bacterium]